MDFMHLRAQFFTANGTEQAHVSTGTLHLVHIFEKYCPQGSDKTVASPGTFYFEKPGLMHLEQRISEFTAPIPQPLVEDSTHRH